MFDADFYSLLIGSFVYRTHALVHTHSALIKTWHFGHTKRDHDLISASIPSK